MNYLFQRLVFKKGLGMNEDEDDIKEFREVPQVCTCCNIHSDYIM